MSSPPQSPYKEFTATGYVSARSGNNNVYKLIVTKSTGGGRATGGNKSIKHHINKKKYTRHKRKTSKKL